MRSWGVLVTIAMGFLFGLVFAGIGGISAGLQASVTDDKLQINKIEEYWAKSDIQKSDLTQLVNNKNCHSSEKYFLACINSVMSGLQKMNLRLGYSGEILESTLVTQNLDNYNEKQNLTPFIRIYNEKLGQSFDFEQILADMIEKNKELPAKYIFALGINGFLSVYRDPHTYILPTDYYSDVTASSDRSPYFVGLSFDKKNGQTFIRKVFKNSDAFVAGLKPLDRIVSINGQRISDLSLAEISQLLKDRKLKSYSFVIERDQAHYVKTIQRSYRVLNQVYSEVLDGVKKTGLIQISKFSKSTCDEVRNDILKMADHNIAGLVLDLRDNPGGQLSEAACLAGLFLGNNRRIYSVKYFDLTKESEVVLTTADQIYSGPLVVLTSNSSASAAELIAGAFQEYHRALIVGEKTFGKGTFQEPEDWLDKKQLSLFKTKGFYLLPSGASTQLAGVTPDIELNDGDEATSESLNYMNPIRPDIYNLNISKKSIEDLPFANCTKTNYFITTNDLFLDEALKLLSCQAVTSGFAHLFSPNEFN
jgi:carboxyl-terminal processing protease